MEIYITLLDSLFLPQGLALHRSMERHLKSYNLWILCIDDNSYNVLKELQLPNLRLLKLSDEETAELKDAKQDRTIGEYCWTLTPHTFKFIFNNLPDSQRVTYLDTDMWFRKDPSNIFSDFELSNKNVLITEHAYAPEYDQSISSGIYCVQFMTFTRGGEEVRFWWEKKCIEWCYARHEDGKFGDQKYLDDWPSRFKDHVHVCNAKESFQAPWNSTRFEHSKAVLWHFHGTKAIIENNKLKSIWTGSYFIPKEVIENIYKPYLNDLNIAVQILNKVSDNIKSQGKPNVYKQIGLIVRQMLKSFSLKRVGLEIKL